MTISIRTVRVLAIALAAHAILISGFAYAEPATDQSIREYLRISGEEERATVAMKNLLPQIRQMLKDIPEDLVAELTRTETGLAPLFPIYRRYFSEEEVQGLIEFYRTPLGAKFAMSAPRIQTEAIALGAKQAQAIIGNYFIQKAKFVVEQQKSAGNK